MGGSVWGLRIVDSMECREVVVDGKDFGKEVGGVDKAGEED